MANSKTQKGGYINSVPKVVFLVIFLVFITLFALQKSRFSKTANPQQISQNAIVNLNSAGEIETANNSDGTMGPDSWFGNASNSLPAQLKGNLTFKVIDPPQLAKKPEKPGDQGNRPTDVVTQTPTNVISSPTQEIVSPVPTQAKRNNGPQNATALNLTITKVEVHMAYQGDPRGTKVKPSVSQSPIDGKKVSHWETLNIISPFTIDLVDLAKTKDFAQLGITQLAAGKYTEVRLYVDSATATLADGNTVSLTILGRDNVVRVVRPFSISAGQNTTLTMDLDAKHSIVKAGGQYLLKPVVSRFIEEKNK